jgi:transposase
MKIIGCDLHARQQTLAMLDSATGEVVKTTLKHEGSSVREFYSSLSLPVRVGIEATGSMQWFVNLMEELGIECLVGHPAEIRAAEPRKQKHDRRDAYLLLSLLVEERFPAIWLPTKELLDLRALLRHRHQWVCLRVKIQNALQAIALANGLRRGSSLWTQAGQQAIASLPLSRHAAYRRNELQAMYVKFEAEIETLNQRVQQQAGERSAARLLMTHPGVGPITALATEVFLGDPSRFASSKELASYVGLIPGEHSSGKLYDSSKKFEQVFVRVTSWKGESIQGILASGLELIHGHSKGDKVNCNESEILDWTISKRDGTEEGNFVGKFLDTY